MTKLGMEAALCFYITAGIIAFGHSAANSHGCPDPDMNPADDECQLIGAMSAAVFWPLYVSWMVFDGIRDT